MNTKHLIIGLIIFSIVTISSFAVFHFLGFNESVSVLAALLIGGVAEIVYRKRKKT